MFRMFVHGLDDSDLTDREKEMLAQDVHNLLVERHDLNPETVAVEGYMEDD